MFKKIARNCPIHICLQNRTMFFFFSLTLDDQVNGDRLGSEPVDALALEPARVLDPRIPNL